MSTNHPLAKAAMLHLGRVWPRSVPFPELLQIARALSERDEAGEGAPLADDSAWLSDSILKLYVARLVELHLHAPAFASEVSERPLGSALARAQIQNGHSVSNLLYGSVEIDDETARRLLSLLDGTRDREQLLAELRADSITAEQLELNLKKLAKLALLAA
jgi:hypothetical protein